MGNFERAGAAGIRNRNDHVDVVIGALAEDLVGEPLAHPQPGLVDGDPVDDRIRPGKIDVFEDARGIAAPRTALLAVQRAIDLDDHRLARQNVAHHLEIERVHGHALRRHHVLDAISSLPPAHAQGPNTMRIAKRDDAVTNDQRDDRIPAPAPAVDGGHGREDGLRREIARCPGS